jgi:hypothetical protein
MHLGSAMCTYPGPITVLQYDAGPVYSSLSEEPRIYVLRLADISLNFRVSVIDHS